MKNISSQDALLALNLIPGIGAIRIRALLDFFGSAELVLAAPSIMLERVNGIGKKIASTITQWESCTDVTREREAAAQMGVRIVSINDEQYPHNLRHMSDAPIILYVKGASIAPPLSKAVSIVGSRSCSTYGRQAAQQFARDLCDQGCSIISGLALGIDAAAHQGALQAGGHTIGVIGSGHGCFYPQENIDLAMRIIENGGSVVSEFPMYMQPSRTSFPQRNRLVAAWSQATLVVEAPNRSGSLHTARLAADEYGRCVFAVPGSIYGLHSIGCHELIRDGAILCSQAQQLIADMRWEASTQPSVESSPRDLFTPPQNPASTDLLLTKEQHIVDAIAAGHRSLEGLCVATGMGAHELNPLLMRLQIKGVIVAQPGAQFALR